MFLEFTPIRNAHIIYLGFYLVLHNYIFLIVFLSFLLIHVVGHDLTRTQFVFLPFMLDFVSRFSHNGRCFLPLLIAPMSISMFDSRNTR